jgi:uncharacterized protein involved in exopolysaccharide biosynthesis
MGDDVQGSRSGEEVGRNSSAQRVVLMLPQGSAIQGRDDEIDLIDILYRLLDGKLTILLITGLFALLGIAYSLLAEEWYRAEVLLAPAEDQTGHGLASQFGGLAALAGVSIRGDSSVEPLAVLKSREFARKFIDEQGLLTIFFSEQWDSASGRWRQSDPDHWPDLRDAVKFFDDSIRRVSEDARTGLVTLHIQWTDPFVAAEWANLLVERLNEQMRSRALREAEENVEYLQKELARTNVVALQQSIGRLLETEMQKLMLARGTSEFAFRVIDPAEPPRRRYKPMRTLTVVLATILGGLCSITFVLLRHAVRNRALTRAT